MDSPERQALIEGRIEGINRAIKILYAAFSYDLKNAENECISEKDREQASNCAMRIGLLCSYLQCEKASIENWKMSEEEKQLNYNGEI